MKLSKKVLKDLNEALKDLKDNVTFKFFKRETECHFCNDTRQLLETVADISDKIKIETFDFPGQKEEADKYGVDKVPATVVMGEKDYGIKFYGIPGGYEFASLIHAVKLISSGENTLKPETKSFLDSLAKEIHLQVFVTPTCPHCPGAVVLAHRMAHYSPKIKADMVEASEFQELSRKYKVMGVPRTIVAETEFLEGAAPEEKLVEKIKAVL